MSIPRLYVVHFTNRPVELAEKELALAPELGFDGVRVGYPPTEIMTADNKAVSPWAQRWIDRDIARYKEMGLKVHLGLGGLFRDGATFEANIEADKWVAERFASTFGPDELSFHLSNEPSEYHRAKPDMPEWKLLVDEHFVRKCNTLVDIYDDSFKAHGYRLYGTTFEGGFDWTSPHKSVQNYHYSMYLDRICDTEQYRWIHYRTRQNFHLYVPNDVDAVNTAVQKCRLGLHCLGKYPQMRQGYAITEFNVRPASATVNQYNHGTRCAKIAKALLAMPELDFATVYCLAYHTEYSFMNPEGVRNEGRIKGWKKVFGLL